MHKINEICLIEDDKIQVFLMERFIHKSGYTGLVTSYENGKVAYDEMLHRFENHIPFPNLIFLDLNMPIWDGWLFYEEFERFSGYEDSLIYILTSSLSEEDISKAKSKGFDERYLRKPLDFNKLKNILENF